MAQKKRKPGKFKLKEKTKMKRKRQTESEENAGDRQSRRQSRPSGSGDKPTHIQGIF